MDGMETQANRANQASYINASDDATVPTVASTLTSVTMADIQTGIQAALAAHTAATNNSIQNALAAHTAATNNSNTGHRQRDRRNTNNGYIENLSATDLAAMGYCWTHGYSHNAAHTSATCSWPNEGHQVTATDTNRMGGNNGRYVHGRRNN